MTTLYRFVHLLGISLWIGGAVAAMVIAAFSRRESEEVRLGAFRLLARVHGIVIAPGAFLTVLTGFLIIAALVTVGAGDALGVTGVIIMQTAGLVAGILAVFVALPTANKIARLSTEDPEAHRGQMARLRRRQALASSTAGVLAILSLAAVVFLR